MTSSALSVLDPPFCFPTATLVRPRPGSATDPGRARTDAAVVAFPGTSSLAAPAPERDDTSRRRVDLGLVGRFELRVDDRTVPLGPAGQRVLALLACRGRREDRGRMAGLLWPETDEARSRANLRTTLYRLQRRVPGIVAVDAEKVGLSQLVDVDLERNSEFARRLTTDQDSGEVVHAPMSAQLLQDDVLPDWEEEWLADVQFSYRQLRLMALESLAQHFIDKGRYAPAVQVALSAVQADRLRETAHQTLIQAWIAQGNRHDALHHFQQYREFLQDEMGLDPSPDTERLVWAAV